MPDPVDELEELFDRPPRCSIQYGQGAVSVFHTPDEVKEMLEDADPDEFVRFNSFTWLGQPPSMTMEPIGLWIERQVIVGFREITRAIWKDLLADQRQEALGARMMPMPMPGGSGLITPGS